MKILPRLYFNSENGSCLGFNYGGCEGNGNNFKTEGECTDECVEKSPATVGCVELYHLDGMLEVTVAQHDLNLDQLILQLIEKLKGLAARQRPSSLARADTQRKLTFCCR